MSEHKTASRYPISDIALVTIAVAGLAVGLALSFNGQKETAAWAWSIATAPVLLALLIEIVTSLRRGDVGLDVLAALSMGAALAFGEPLAGNVVALMYAGGQLLERFAEGRARAEMSALLGRVAHTAMRRSGDNLEEVPIDTIVPGDVVMIRQGEVLPVDGRVAPENTALLDLSALTGEPLPVRLTAGGDAESGSTSAGPPFDLIATRPAAESTYAGIVRLIEAAQATKSPMVRLADRYAVGFLVLTLAIAGLAWLLTQDPIRALAVLVVATPCPLILAVPIAVIAGMSKAAKNGALIKSGADFETLGRVKVAILDKTGTLTEGTATLAETKAVPGWEAPEVLRLAASLDQASGHVVAGALISAATAAGLDLTPPTEVVESPGSGIEGVVEGHRVVVGGDKFVAERAQGSSAFLHPQDRPSALTVAVGIDGQLAGILILEDRLRPDAEIVVRDLRDAGLSRVVLASGDRTSIARSVGDALGIDEVIGDLSPEQKLEIVRREAPGGTVMMVGDGVNDSPALAAADVGVAMGARGTAVSAQTAGVVVLVDALNPLVQAIRTARRSRRIALQSVWAGIGLSVAAMIVAAFGYLTPVEGALLQEAIDVAVIFNALRALR